MDLRVATAEGLVSIGTGEVAFEGEVVSCLARDGDDLLALVGGHSLWRLGPDGGASEIASAEDRLNCIGVFDREVLVGASDARLLELAGDELRRNEGFEGAPGRAEWFTPWGGPPDVRSLAQSSGGDIYANVHVGGILRSSDGGASWMPTIDIYSDVHQVVAGDGAILVGAASWGLVVSRDGGSEWSASTDGLHAHYCRAVALVGDTVFLTASVGPHGGRSALYRRALDGDRFDKCTEGLPEWFGDNIDTGCLAVTSDGVAFGTSDGFVYSSSDGGSTWEQVAEGLRPVRWLLG